MKDTILKIAKCKDGASFYKKFPTEEAFMKVHGEEFKLAQDGLSSFDFKGSQMGTIMGGANLLGNVVNGIQGIKEEKELRRQTEQTRAVSDVALQATRTRPEEIKRQYVRPEDIENTGEEFFPIYGVGTNVLAQNGQQIYSDTDLKPTYAPRNNGEIQNTYSPEYTLYDDLEYEDMQFGGNIYGQINQTMNNGLDPLYGENAGKDLGGTLGGAVGSLFGPAGNLIGTQVGKLAGWAFDRNPQKIKKNQDATMRNMAGMAGMGVGAAVQQQYSNVAQDGSELLGGDLQTHWGGKAELASYNPFLPQGGETVEFKGNMHNGSNVPGQSGIGITYGDSPVEVEGGEQATILEGQDGQENLTVYGNLKIPKGMLGDKNADNKKFKNYIKDISNKEEKANKSLTKNMEELDGLVPITSFDKLKMSSLEANILGNNMKLKQFAEKKQNAASLQKAINDTAQEWGVVADDLARGKLKVDKGVFTPSNKTAQYGAELPMAQNGLPPVSAENYTLIKSLYDKAKNSKNPQDVVDFQKKYHELAPKYAQAIIDSEPLTNYGKQQNLGKTLESNVDGLFGKRTERYMASLLGKNFISPASELTPIGYKNPKITAPEYKGVSSVVSPPKENQEENYLSAINSVLPMWRPTDQSQFDNNQLMGEMFALSHNQVEPVPAQGYRPQLDVPYDISLQDQLNAITSQTRAGQKLAGYNPAAQAIMAGAAYDPSTKVLGEQFRLNQAKKDQVYSGNRATLNDAQLKNLQIYDTQAGRQSQARSNTKEATQLALNSMSDKYAKHKLENRTLGIYENMYNYRYTDKGRAVNMNPVADFDTQIKDGITNQMSPADQLLYAQEMMKRTKKQMNEEDDVPSLATPGYTATGSRQKNGGTTSKVLTKMPLVRALKGY